MLMPVYYCSENFTEVSQHHHHQIEIDPVTLLPKLVLMRPAIMQGWVLLSMSGLIML
jgi:hypothetical protein